MTTPQALPERIIAPSTILSEEKHIGYKFLFIGESGAGKTKLACEIAADPRIERVALIRADKGTDSVREGRSKITAFDVPLLDANKRPLSIFKSLQLIKMQLDADIRAGKFDVLVIDSISSLAKKTLDEVRGDAVQAAEMAGKVPPPIDIRFYGTNTSYIEAFVRHFTNYNIHVIATCVEKLSEDEATKRPISDPELTGALAKSMPQYFGIVGYIRNDDKMERDELKRFRRLILAPDRQYHLAKVRIPDASSIPPYLINPTMTDILNMLDKARKED